LFNALYGKQIQFCTLTSSPTVHSLPKMVMLWILTPFLTILVEWEVMGVGVPSTRAQAPTVLPHPTMEYSTQASCLISASSKTMASLMRTPGPMRARAPMETLGPSLAVGSTDAEGWMYTGGRIFADGFASSSDCAWNAFVKYRALAGTAE